MVCKNCKKDYVIQLTNNNVKLCKNCFIKYFERKVVKTISKYNMLQGKIAIGVSGGKDSFSLMYILNKIKNRRKLDLVVISIDEGIKGYRIFDEVEKFCKKEDLPFYKFSFKKEFGKALDKLGGGCTVCGVLRRYLLNKKARELKCERLVIAHNLDDSCQSILMNQLKNSMERSARLGPIMDKIDCKFIPRIKPLYFLLEDEVRLYSSLKKFPIIPCDCPYAKDSLRNNVRQIINEFEKKYRGSKHAIVNSFLEIWPLLRKHYKGKVKYCSKCKEPSSSEICKVCEIIKKVK